MIIKKSEKDERREKIIDVAFRLFVNKKIESVTMGEIAKEAGIGRATLFRYFPGKLELVIAVNTKEWKEYFDELDQKRPMSSVGDIPAIGRLIFTLDSFIEMYQTHKALLRYNDNFNHYVSHSCAYYAGGFIWGSKENEDYTPELIKLKEMILAYVKA